VRGRQDRRWSLTSPIVGTPTNFFCPLSFLHEPSSVACVFAADRFGFERTVQPLAFARILFRTGQRGIVFSSALLSILLWRCNSS
jgi:hypothetical protein